MGAPPRGMISASFSFKSTRALPQPIDTVSASPSAARTYLSPEKSRAVASASGGSQYLFFHALVKAAAFVSDCTTSLRSSTNVPAMSRSPDLLWR